MTEEQRDAQTLERQRAKDDLGRRVQASIAAFDALPPEEKKRLRRQQFESYVLGEAAMGSDADEVEYAEALRSKDAALIAACEQKAQERVENARRVLANGRA